VRIYFYYGPSHREDGASSALLTAMQRLGHEPYRFHCIGDPANFGKADLHIEVDWAADCFLEKQWIPPHPNFFWCSDTHCSEAAYRYRLEHARQFDLVAVNIKNDIKRFRKDGVKAFWLPYAADPWVWRHIEPQGETPKHDIVFAGFWANYDKRIDFLDEMCKAFPNSCLYDKVYNLECAERMGRGAIALNHCQTTEINMRVMEALAAKCFLLTPAIPTLAELGLRDGVHLATYRNMDEAKEKARYYLDHPTIRAWVAAQGRKVVLENHTYVHRALTILDKFGDHPETAYTKKWYGNRIDKEKLRGLILPKDMW
jgi:hypothetical protein